MNGIRPMTTFDSAPPTNSHVAASARPGGAWRRAIHAKAATATSAASTPTSRGPASTASGAKSSE